MREIPWDYIFVAVVAMIWGASLMLMLLSYYLKKWGAENRRNVFAAMRRMRRNNLDDRRKALAQIRRLRRHSLDICVDVNQLPDNRAVARVFINGAPLVSLLASSLGGALSLSAVDGNGNDIDTARIEGPMTDAEAPKGKPN